MAKKPAGKKTMNKKAMKKAKGGVLIGMLLPAVQKAPANAGGANVLLGDGSVRFINSSVDGI